MKKKINFKNKNFEKYNNGNQKYFIFPIKNL